MKTKSLKLGRIFMLILGFYRVLLCIYFYSTRMIDIQNSLVFLSNAVAVLAVTQFSYKKGEKWAWWCLLLIGVLPLISGLLWNATHPGVIAGWVLLLLGLFLPFKAFFK